MKELYSLIRFGVDTQGDSWADVQGVFKTKLSAQRAYLSVLPDFKDYAKTMNFSLREENKDFIFYVGAGVEQETLCIQTTVLMEDE